MNRKVKNTIIRIISLLMIFLLFILNWSCLKYILIDDSKSYTRVMMHEFYTQDNIDVLFMGASHCYRGFNPEITDSLLECNTFNAGSSSQGLDTTYLLMKEAISKYNLKHIYLDLSYNIATLDLEDNSKLTNSYIITDYMKPSIRKYWFLLNKSGSDNYANSFLIARRQWKDIFDWNSIENTISKKNSKAYRNYEYPTNGAERYAGKGFVKEEKFVKEGSFKDSFENEIFDINRIDEKWVDTLKKMIVYCDTHNVKLTLISTPISSYRLSCYKNYDDYIEFVKRIIKETGLDVEYVDFNLMKSAYWEDSSLLFKDYSHLNTEGAEKFSRIFCEYINGKIKEDDLFYNSIAEKYESMPPTFYGILYNQDFNDENISCTMILNHPEEIVSRVTLISETQNLIVKDWGKTTDFQIPNGFIGECQIEVAEPENKENIKYYTVQF